ncbi:MAG: class I SAM-dependent methyltransferase [Oscillospiraceae bacterium]|nr:class I SAM-dependent methyltransferase [Oscillospiraceae bacterium]
MSNYLDEFNAADRLMNDGRLEEALNEYFALEKNREIAPFCYFRIAQISNMIGEPEEAYDLYYKAFTAMPNIASRMFIKEHPSFNYVFHGMKKEVTNVNCPLCGTVGVPRWCYPLVEAGGYNEFFNPIRMWMFCDPCNHVFARDFPEKLFIYNDNPRKAEPAYFSYYSSILASIRRSGFSSGMSLFEVGIGAGECLLAAREIGYEAFGIDVIERHVEDVVNNYGLDAEVADFLEFESDRKWDVIIMGDVLEHVSNPDLALAKAESLLHDDGALWISTPTFESAYSCVIGHNDVMRRQQYHLNYFSRESLYALLERNYLFPVDYQISAHFNGSMEVIAIKESRGV